MGKVPKTASALLRTWQGTDEQIVQFVNEATKSDSLQFVQSNSPVRQVLHRIKMRAARVPLSGQSIESLRIFFAFLAPPPLSHADKAAGAAALNRIVGENVTRNYAELAPFFSTLERLRLESKARKTMVDLRNRVQALLDKAPPLAVQATDAFGIRALAEVQASGPASGGSWAAVFVHSQSLNSTMPSNAWKKKAGELVSEIGQSWIPVLEKWFDEVGRPSPVPRSNGYGGQLPATCLNASSADLLKGLVWACAAADVKASIPLLGLLANKAFKKYPALVLAAQSSVTPASTRWRPLTIHPPSQNWHAFNLKQGRSRLRKPSPKRLKDSAAERVCRSMICSKSRYHISVCNLTANEKSASAISQPNFPSTAPLTLQSTGLSPPAKAPNQCPLL